MAKPTSASKPKVVSAKDAAVAVLREEGGPLRIEEISKRVLQNHKTGLKGKTPEASIAAMLHVSAKKGELFRKVDKGTFELLPAAVAGETEQPAEDGDAAAAKDPATDLQQQAKVAARAAKPDPKKSDKKTSSKSSGRKKVAA